MSVKPPVEIIPETLLLTQAGGLYVGNMVDTTYSLVASIEKAYLGSRANT